VGNVSIFESLSGEVLLKSHGYYYYQGACRRTIGKQYGLNKSAIFKEYGKTFCENNEN